MLTFYLIWFTAVIHGSYEIFFTVVTIYLFMIPVERCRLMPAKGKLKDSD